MTLSLTQLIDRLTAARDAGARNVRVCDGEEYVELVGESVVVDESTGTVILDLTAWEQEEGQDAVDPEDCGSVYGE